MGCGAFHQRLFGPKGARPLNVLLFMCDQYQADAMGHSGDKNALTPNLDSLAARGIVFEQAYCQAPGCTPSRLSMILGRYCNSQPWPTSPIPPFTRSLVSFPQAMRAAGYKTGCFGKLHVAGRDDLDWDEYKHLKESPDYKPEPGMMMLPGGIRKREFPLGAPSPLPEESNMEWRAKEDTIRFMKKNRKKPWFIQCSFAKPHAPLQPPQRHWDMIDREKLEIPRYPKDDLDDVNPVHWERNVKDGLDKITDEDVLDGMQGYYGNIAFCDELFGEVLAKLDELGLRENTLVVFTADHGEMLYAHGLWKKFCFFDESVRVPLIITHPAKIRPGHRTKALVELIDLYPTFMDCLGLETPDTVEGESLVALMSGLHGRHKDVVRSEVFGGAMTQFDGRYKVIDNGPDVAPELYDHQKDPREITNLAAQPKHRDRVERVLDELRKWKQHAKRG